MTKSAVCSPAALRASGLRRCAGAMLAVLLVGGLAADSLAYRGKRSSESGDSREEYKANDMLRRGTEFLEQNQEERGVKLIASVAQMFPNSPVRYRAYMALGRHYRETRDFDLAVKQFQYIDPDADPELQAEALYEIGICYYNLNSFDKAFVTLRKVTNEFPWTVYANEAYYYIGLCHFKLGRWSKAAESLEMVGTSVPAMGDQGEVFAEAGQRLFVKIFDKDLVVLETSGDTLEVEVTTDSGDKETIALTTLGRSGEYFLGSVQTQPGEPAAEDGVLQIRGCDRAVVEYVDKNTESGTRDRRRLFAVRIMSTASAGFTDGAFREYTHGVFADSDCFVRIKDLDRNTGPGLDSVSCRVFTRYKVEKQRDEALEGVDLSEEEEEVRVRDSVTLSLQETDGHSGIFVGSTLPVMITDPAQVVQGDNTLSAMEGDVIVVSYNDEFHAGGADAREIEAEARILVGTIQDVKIEHRQVDELEVKARKELVEAKIFLKLGSIFKEVGLNQNAYEKAEEGLDRVEEIIRTSLKASLDRGIVEEAFRIKWELLLVQDKLSQAINVCHTLTRLFPDSTLVDQALLKIGVAKMNAEDQREVNEAVSIFTSVLRLPKSNLKAEAAYRIAEVYERRAEQYAENSGRKPDLSHAMLAYKKCAETYPDSPFAGDSLDKIINFYINNGDYQRAIELMERVFEDYPDASFLDRVLLKWGIAAYRLRDYQTASQKFEQLLTEFPQSNLAPKVTALKAKIDEKLN